MRQQLGLTLGAVAFVLFIGIGIHSTFFRVTNEIGPIGADKAGRQIFLQTLQHYLGDPLGVMVTSEWSDSTFFGRLLIQEPMRTTIRFVAPETLAQPNHESPNQFLNTSFREFFGQFNPPAEASVSLRENYEIRLSDFYAKLDALGASSVEDMLAAMGFRRFDVYHGERLFAARDLPTVGRANVKWVGGDE